jgi:hypothetical protein
VIRGVGEQNFGTECLLKVLYPHSIAKSVG